MKDSLLGKGGYAIVWKVWNIVTNEIFAAKQFPWVGRRFDESSDNEIQIHKIFKNFEAKKESHPGFNCITKLKNTVEDSKDRWLLYELGGNCLTKELFDVKGEFFKGERIYQVKHMPLYYKLKKDFGMIKKFMTCLLHAFDLFA